MARRSPLPPIAEHTVAPELLTRAVTVLVVGCGGTGSAMVAGLPFLHQAMVAMGHPGGLHVTLADDDLVSPTNIVRQPFTASEIGHPKAVVLANRVNLFYGLRWKAATERLLPAGPPLTYDVVVGCVDTRVGRRAIERRTDGRSVTRYWLDVGNEASTGQFVLGQPANARNPRDDRARLRTVAELYPEIVDAHGDARDAAPACSALEALERQEPFVNQAVVVPALALLARLFRHGRTGYHGGFVNLASGRVASLPISAESWARIDAANTRTARLAARREARAETKRPRAETTRRPRARNRRPAATKRRQAARISSARRVR